MLDSCTKNTLRLLHAERPTLAEDIDELRELATGRGGDHLLANYADILFRIVAVLGGYNVRSKQRRDHRPAPLFGGFGDGFQRLISASKLRPYPDFASTVIIHARPSHPRHAKYGRRVPGLTTRELLAGWREYLRRRQLSARRSRR